MPPLPVAPSHPRPGRRHARRAIALGAVPLLTLGLLQGSAGSAAADQHSPGVTARAAAPLPSTVAADARIARKIPLRMKAKALGKHVSVKVADLTGGRLIMSKHANVPRLPASNMKLITAVTAMETMGLDKRFPTDVVAQGPAGRKVVIVGGGDPVLTSSQLQALARRTASALVAKLPPPVVTPPTPPAPAATPPTPPVAPAPPRAENFRVYVDDSLFATPTLAPGWPSSYQPYVVRPVRALVRDGRDTWDSGTDAARYFADQVRTALTAAVRARPDLAVTVRFRGSTTAAPDAAPLASFEGNSLRAALSWMLLVSDNDIAEMLYRQSALATGRPATWAGGRAAATATMAALGVRTTGLVLADGSGVSRADRVTATALVQLLRRAAAAGHPELNTLRSMLPVSGVSGTLKSANGRYTTKPSRCAKGRISAKTGTLHDTIALSGYTVGADGRDKIFSILVNHRPERRFSPLSTRRAVDVIAATVTGCT